jgi:RNA polymerase sigma factor for flagellar operon FliA
VLSFSALPEHVGEQSVMASGGQGADSGLLDRERQAYLIDAIEALPPRLRRVVIGYFFEERPMLELAQELGVTESRISQMRAEAMVLLRDGINSQLDPDMVPAPKKTREARRRAAYYAAIASGSDYRARLTSPGPALGAARAETSA